MKTNKQKKSKVYFPYFSHNVFVLFSFRQVFSIFPCMYLISVFPYCSVFFPIYGRKYSMKAKLFMENLWKLSFSCIFVLDKVNISMYAGEFFFCLFFVPYKVNISIYEGGFKQVQYKEYICWIQVKNHISDQTALRICNSVIVYIIPTDTKVEAPPPPTSNTTL
jgi:hypothetical protein